MDICKPSAYSEPGNFNKAELAQLAETTNTARRLRFFRSFLNGSHPSSRCLCWDERLPRLFAGLSGMDLIFMDVVATAGCERRRNVCTMVSQRGWFANKASWLKRSSSSEVVSGRLRHYQNRNFDVITATGRGDTPPQLEVLIFIPSNNLYVLRLAVRKRSYRNCCQFYQNRWDYGLRVWKIAPICNQTLTLTFWGGVGSYQHKHAVVQRHFRRSGLVVTIRLARLRPLPNSSNRTRFLAFVSHGGR